MVDSNLNILIQRDLFHMAANNENSPNCEESCCEHEEQSCQAVEEKGFEGKRIRI